MQETPVRFLGQEDPLEKRWLSTSGFLGFPVAQTVKNVADVGDLGSSMGWEDPWRRAWQPTPYTYLEDFHGQKSLVGYSS